jgi:glutamine synthetase
MSVEADWFLRANPDITTIEALLPDCNGVMRGKWLPRHKLAKVYQGEFKLPITALSLDIWGRDVEELVFESGDADGICRPIEGSLLPTPWTVDDSLGQVMLSLYNTDGTPYPGDPRHVLKRILNRFHKAGWRPVVAAELEFSLVLYDRDGIHHTCPRPVGGMPIGGNTYGVDVLQNNAALLEDIRRACEIQELPFDGIVKESAPSQYEINMQHVDNPVLAADQIQMMKRLIKGVAAKHGMVASFMAKPFENEAGNGMHVHCSLLDERGDNIFDDGSEKGSDQLRHAIAGCMEYMAESTAIFAPNFNSYRRFQPGAHAPTSPGWGYENRTV